MGPRFAELLDWVEGRLERGQAQRVAEYVVTDPVAAETVAWIEQFLGDVRSAQLHTPPPELSARLRAIFRDGESADAEPAPATLIRESPTTGPAAQSTDGVARAHLAFECSLGRFVIEVQAGKAHRVDLSGLLLFNGCESGMQLSFVDHGALRRTTRSDSAGRFMVQDVPEAVDEVVISGDAGRTRAQLDLRPV